MDSKLVLEAGYSVAIDRMDNREVIHTMNGVMVNSGICLVCDLTMKQHSVKGHLATLKHRRNMNRAYEADDLKRMISRVVSAQSELCSIMECYPSLCRTIGECQWWCVICDLKCWDVEGHLDSETHSKNLERDFSITDLLVALVKVCDEYLETRSAFERFCKGVDATP